MSTDPQTRNSLIRRLGDLDDDLAWMEFLQIYEPMLFRLASKWGVQEADAAEVVQETLLAVAKAIPNYRRRSHPAAFRGWLAAIARNKLADHLAKYSKQARGSGDTNVHRWLEEQSDDCGGESVWDWNSKKQIFLWAAAKVRTQVNETTWQAFYQTYIAGQPISQVANDLGIRPGMVYVARSRVMSRLRKAVESWTDDQPIHHSNSQVNDAEDLR